MTLVRTRKVLNSNGAATVLAAAAKHATTQGNNVVIAVVDPWGNLLLLDRVGTPQPASSQVAIDKARTAAVFIRPSREIEAQVTDGRLGALALHDAAALIGGVPIVVDGQVVGAVGTSGETPDEDEAVSLAGAAVDAATTAQSAVTYEGAQMIATAVDTESQRRGVAPVVSIVDAGGRLLYLLRPDAAQVASVGVATDKARTAAIFRRPSKVFEDQATGGRPSALHLAGAVPLQGGMPIIVDGDVAGAIGVSGASSADEDQELAALGASLLDAGTLAETVAYVDRDTMERTFAKGGLVVDTPTYKVDAGRRTEPGEVEYHERVTDIMYVLDGEATVVTGGEMQDVRVVGPGERRAARTTGGIAQRITPGDVLVVPAAVPHHFTEVTDPFRYYVVKVAR